jgi:type I restriction enzyme R subunit
MDSIHIYTPEEVNDFASLYLKEKQSNRDVEKMNNLIDRAVERFEKHEEEEQEEFRVMAIKYLRAYNFIIQIYPLKNSNLFKLYLYLSGLVKNFLNFIMVENSILMICYLLITIKLNKLLEKVEKEKIFQ